MADPRLAATLVVQIGGRLLCVDDVGASSVACRRTRGGRLVVGRTGRGHPGRPRGRRRTGGLSGDGEERSASTTITAGLAVPARCVVPRLRGLSLASAPTRLGEEGCRARARAGSLVERGHALGTVPGAGARRPDAAVIVARVRR